MRGVTVLPAVVVSNNKTRYRDEKRCNLLLEETRKVTEIDNTVYLCVLTKVPAGRQCMITSEMLTSGSEPIGQ